MAPSDIEKPRTPGRVLQFPSPRGPKVDPLAPPVTQERLRQCADLWMQELTAIRAMREFTLQLEADMAGGAEVEAGELVFDRDLKVVRHKRQAEVENLRWAPAPVEALGAVR